ncbi:MAG: phosphoglycerate mutase [Aequorivita sp.]|nr:phosphoglycerate mutase [Aequorivita sp.]|tara:strand:+ start:96214 stop:96759 length:546 start_codon:yes stop_codon:yes gene_type:complete
MKYFIILILAVPLFTFCGQSNEKSANSQNKLQETDQNINATYYLIRHAEKDRSNPKNHDPNLNIDGMLRAKRWAEYFEPIKIDEIYITKYIRTKQTVSLIAQQKAISPKRYNPKTIYSNEFLNQTNGKTVLIAGHSNTTPQLVNKLISEEKYSDMDDSDNATLFKVTINGNNKSVETIIVE